ncbi:hypothetical protein PRIPAC_79851 [Pristionchus pacificus]|uniref:EGF-like domain-containing protein n=1 Tax=Pristionchus pacificus TaxID=54126 RepID=H3FY50_PRIPA|nr:hypothetical protein PRIPAC_77968 [Pristionchus pacificus]KAF8371634.1 hypothetical protein PRIPAC_78063 [Pristionchus pacificus]KAF8373422.1 hypothetical protein PRIPAC_79851 [Pristionchus pacificus]|eukprot:PDM78198.1 hypothetical protein PRIPAC_30777 [Pristionchus pacificus]
MIRWLVLALLVATVTSAEQPKKAPRIQNQQPAIIDIFLGVGQIICAATGQCRPRNPCPPNTVFRQGCPCEPTCTNRNPPCTAQCRRPRCQCRPGMIRNPVGQCVFTNMCPIAPPPRCIRPNEVWRQCSTCEGTCQNQNPICTLQCRPPRCQCRTGFVRNNIGVCVRPTTCPRPGCTGANQFWNPCPWVNEPTCQNPWPTCPLICPIGGRRCQCRPGFYRASSAPNAPCVPWQFCWRFPWPRANPVAIATSPIGRPWCWWGGPRRG